MLILKENSQDILIQQENKLNKMAKKTERQEERTRHYRTTGLAVLVTTAVAILGNIYLSKQAQRRAELGIYNVPATIEQKVEIGDDFCEPANNFDYVPEMNYSKTNESYKVNSPAPKKDTKKNAPTPAIPQIRNNNPGNLRPVRDKCGNIVKWKGQIGEKNGFCVFNNLENGFRAMGRNLQDYDRLYDKNTITEIISRWAPKEDNNDTQAYIKTVSAKTGYHPNQELDLENKDVATNLIIAMTRQEHSADVPKYLVDRSISSIYN